MTNLSKAKSIAIVGSGVSGLVAGHILSRRNHVTVFEANNYLGGHTATVDVDIDGRTQAVDTGFIVYNDRTYPNFIQLLEQLGIEGQKTEMSFSVRNATSGLEYNGHNLNTLFAQRRNLLNFKFYRFIKEILRFNRLAKKTHPAELVDDEQTLADFLAQHRFDSYFSNNYILPMVAAIWSSSIKHSQDMPLRFFLQFFKNHGLLDITHRPQWYVVKGGSKSYIPALVEPIQELRLNTAVQSVSRVDGRVRLTVSENNAVHSQDFDEVVIACHSNQALQLLADPTPDEKNVLGKLNYANNEVVLHTDKNLLPRAPNAIASWNYWLDGNTDALPSLTYCMNVLQQLNTPSTVCVTLNKTKAIAAEKIMRKFIYSHPVFTSESIKAQQRRKYICGLRHTHFCGAYWYNGFHEDGVKSALDVCARFGENLQGPIVTGDSDEKKNGS